MMSRCLRCRGAISGPLVMIALALASLILLIVLGITVHTLFYS